MESDLIKQKAPSLHRLAQQAALSMFSGFPLTCLESSSFQCTIWALGQMLFKRKIQLYSPFLNIFAAAMPFLHVPEELQVSRVQLHLLSAGCSQHFLCAGSTSGASWALQPAPLGAELQGPGLEQQLESSKAGAGTCTWVCFSLSPWGYAW